MFACVFHSCHLRQWNEMTFLIDKKKTNNNKTPQVYEMFILPFRRNVLLSDLKTLSHQFTLNRHESFWIDNDFVLLLFEFILILFQVH